MKIKKIQTNSLIAVAVASALTLSCSKQPELTTANSDNSASSIMRVESSALSSDYADFRAKQVSNVKYALSITLDEVRTDFDGVNVINFDMKAGNTKPLTIDFELGQIHHVLVNNKPVEWQFKQWFITLEASNFVDGANTIEISYTRPYSTDGSGLHRFKDPENGEVYLYSDFEPYDANRLFPHFDQPNIKAQYTLKVTAPKSWQVISATAETSIDETADSKHWSFPESKLISSYVFSLHAGPYQVWHDNYQNVPLRLFARQSLAQYVKTDEWFTPTKQSFEFFNKYFDIDYPFGKYDQIIAPDYNSGAMENVAAVTFNESYVSRGEKSTASKRGLANTIAHELAHMWFGDLVTMDWWNGLWLNESFATYMANLALDKASDYDNIWDSFYAGTKQWAYWSDQSVTTHPIELPVLNTDEALSNFDGITYGKGASVLKQIPYLLGEENFRIGVSNYLKKYSYKNTSLNDFMSELGKAANRDLSQWTQDWLYTAGLNTVKVDYQCDMGNISSMTINQTAPADYPTLREQRVQIGLYNLTENSLNLTNNIAITYQGAKTDVAEAIGMKCPDLVYPNEADWGFVKVELDQKSFETLTAHINKIDNTTMRLMLWQSLWDSVRDGKLPLNQFTDFTIANIGLEKDDNIVRKVAGLLNSSNGYYIIAQRQGKNGDVNRSKIEQFNWEQLQKAKPNSEQQKIWFSNYTNSVFNTEHLENLYKMLQGELNIAGIELDQDKRWNIVETINQFQFKDYKAILAREIERDSSDIGVKSAIAAEVVRPDPEVKAKWFNVVINNPDNLKLATLKTIMNNLFPGSQAELQTSYTPIVLEKLVEFNDTKELGFLSTFASAFTPTSCSTDSVELMTKAVEDLSKLKPQVTKTYRIALQEDQRCLAILKLL